MDEIHSLELDEITDWEYYKELQEINLLINTFH